MDPEDIVTAPMQQPAIAADEVDTEEEVEAGVEDVLASLEQDDATGEVTSRAPQKESRKAKKKRKQLEAAAGEAPAATPPATEEPVAAPVPQLTLEFLESGEPEQYLLMTEDISRETLVSALGPENPVDELNIVYTSPDGVTTPISTWAIPLVGQAHLIARKYKCSTRVLMRITKTETVEGGDPTVVSSKVVGLLALTLPDGTAATAAVDPKDLLEIVFPSDFRTSQFAARVRDAITKYIRAIGKSHMRIEVTRTGGVPTARSLEVYHIELYGSFTRSNNRDYTLPSRMFGLSHPAGGQNVNFVPSLDHDGIVDESSVELGCVGPNRLAFYGMSSMTHQGLVDILEKFFEVAVAVATGVGRDTEEEIQAKYVKTVVDYAGNELRSCESEFESHRRTVEQRQTELMEAVAAEAENNRKIHMLKYHLSEYADLAKVEFDQIRKLNHVKHVYWRGQVMCLRTDEICVVDPRTGHLHSIGEFIIVIDIITGTPRWFNQTRRINAYRESQMAPHVWADGTACLGSMSGTLPKLVASRKFFQAALSCVMFVESVNTGDPAGKQVHRWPIRKLREGARQLEDSGPLLNE